MTECGLIGLLGVDKCVDRCWQIRRRDNDATAHRWVEFCLTLTLLFFNSSGVAFLVLPMSCRRYLPLLSCHQRYADESQVIPTMNCHKLHCTTRPMYYHHYLPWTTIYCHELFSIAINYIVLICASMNDHLLPWSTINYHKLPWATMYGHAPLWSNFVMKKVCY